MNSLEKAIIAEIIEFNKQKYPFLEKHIPFLKVKSRENTGVGMYINFEYSSEKNVTIEQNKKDISLSSNKLLELNNLQYGLVYELNITNGKFDFLELVTQVDEEWDGKYTAFRFRDVLF